MRRLAICVAVLCMTGVAFADEAGNQRAAERDAVENLALLRLPDGAVRVDENPAADPATLDQAGLGVSSSPNQVVHSQFWRVPGNPWDVFAWLKKHPPAGTHLGGYGHGGDRSGPKTWSVSFVRPPVWEVMDTRELVITTSAAEGGGTALRADGVATWLVPRPASATIPAGAQSLRITIHGGQDPKTPPLRVTETDPTHVVLATRILNRLPLVQPGVYMCPLDRGIRAHLDFRDAAGTTLADADAELGGCATVQLSVGGAKQPALNGWDLFADLEAAFGHHIDLTALTGGGGISEPLPVIRIARGHYAGVPYDAFAYDGGPRSGVCVTLLLAGIQQGTGWCLLHKHGKRAGPFTATTCYPRAVTAVGVVGKNAAGAPAKLDDGTKVALASYELPHPTVTTRIGLLGDRVVKLKHPAKIELGYRGPFAFGFARGMHSPMAAYSLFPHC